MEVIKRRNISRLHKDECSAFLENIRDITDQLPNAERGDEGAQPQLDTAVRDFCEKVNRLAASDSKRPKNAGVAEASRRDAERDKLWRASKAFIKALTKHPDEATAAAAKRVHKLYENEGDPTSRAQTKASTAYHNLLVNIARLDDETKEKSGIQPWYDSLKAAQDAFYEADELRAQIDGARQIGIARQTRQEAEKAFRNLVKMVNSLVYLQGDAPYLNFINQVNADMDRQKAIEKKRNTLRKIKKEKEEEDTAGKEP